MQKIVQYVFLFILIAGVTSCKKFLDVNTNPNSPTSAPINGLLLRTTQQTAINVFNVGNITSNYVQYLASPNAASPSDTYDQIDAGTAWTNLYDVMTDIYDMEQQAIASGATQYQGVSKVLMAMNLSLVHNVWGAGPFSEAFSGETLTPKFDDANTLYQRSLSLLDEALTLLGQTGGTRTIPTGATSPDLIHQGKTVNWVKTAYALKARLLNQLSKTQQYNPTAIFDALSKAYTSNADDAFVTTYDVRNPWNNVAERNAGQILDGWLSEFFVISMRDTLYGIQDPRLPLIGTVTQFGDYRGTRNGKGRVGTGINREESYLSTTGFYSSQKSPVYIVTYDEMKFIEAEVAFRTSDLPRAYDAYLEGIRANMNKMGVAAAARDAYINDPRVSVGANNLTLETIFREKWKALFLSPVTWDDARRFNYAYPGFQLPLNAVQNTPIRRLIYPNVEISRNGANVPDVGSVIERLWWDQ
jgi:effector-binding domain-containing protein